MSTKKARDGGNNYLRWMLQRVQQLRLELQRLGRMVVETMQEGPAWSRTPLRTSGRKEEG